MHVPMLSAVLGAPAADVVGTWPKGPIMLPGAKLPNVPLLGNGFLGVAFGSPIGGTSKTSSSAIGPNGSGALDMWLNTNAFWACKSTGSAGNHTPNEVPAVCARRALGGVSLSASSASAAFSTVTATQLPLLGQVKVTLGLPAGGDCAVRTTSVVHPASSVLLTTLSYSVPAAAACPPEVTLNVSTWALGDPYDAFPSVQAGCHGCAAASRRLYERGTNATMTPRIVWGALATRIVGGSGRGSGGGAAAATLVREGGWGGAVGGWQTVTLQAGATGAGGGSTGTANDVFLITAFADNLRSNSNTVDPAAAAAALAAATDPPPAAAAAVTHWASFHNASSVRLPSQPALERYWWGAQFITGAMTPAAAMLASTDPAAPGALAPPSGLYGPWVTSDGPSWNGDYTLDYNQEAQFYGVHSSNHPELATGYFPPIVAWEGHARAAAQAVSASANLSCGADALHFACHLAPWGFQSFDQATYMHWNGFFAALLFVNDWEYTRNATTARDLTLPLLAGLNAWSHCYLQEVPGGGGSYVFLDYVAASPDEEHEGQKVPNPQIGLALMLRVARAHVEIGAALGVKVPSYVSDIVAHLPPPNVCRTHVPSPAPAPGPVPSGFFALEAATRCSADYHMGKEATLAACERGCYEDATCDAFTFCNGTVSSTPAGRCAGAGAKPAGQPSCWRYAGTALTCSGGAAGFTSGVHSGGNSSNATVQVWTAFANATVRQSDNFALYPSWPSETVNAIDTRATDSATRAVAARSSQVYSKLVSDRPVLVFSAAVRGLGLSAEGIVAGLNGWLAKAEGANFVPSAPGGGTENVGVTQAINDMLVQAPGGRYIVLFPVWPKAEPASFERLRTKGGFLVSATWDNATRAVATTTTTTAAAAAATALHGGTTAAVTIEATAEDCTSCTLQAPWGSGAALAVSCGGVSVAIAVDGDRVSWPMKRGDVCTVLPAAAE